MRKIVALIAFIFCARSVHAMHGAPVTDVGLDYSTSVAIVVSTTPVLLLSTGTNVAAQPPCTNGPNPLIWTPGQSTNTAVLGQYLLGRNYLEIRNDSGNNIWIGPSASVSTQTTPNNPNYGVLIPTATGRIDSDSYPCWYVVAATTTFPVTVIQKK